MEMDSHMARAKNRRALKTVISKTANWRKKKHFWVECTLLRSYCECENDSANFIPFSTCSSIQHKKFRVSIQTRRGKSLKVLFYFILS